MCLVWVEIETLDRSAGEISVSRAPNQESVPMSKLLRRSALLVFALSLAACASAPPPPPDLTPPPRRGPDAKTTLENHY